jgi:hypothetical protein
MLILLFGAGPTWRKGAVMPTFQNLLPPSSLELRSAVEKDDLYRDGVGSNHKNWPVEAMG